VREPAPETCLVKAAGFKIGLATTCEPDELKVYLDKLGIKSLIDAVACGSDVKHDKPHPDLFELGLRRLCCDASTSLALGDTPYDAKPPASSI
jgi:phosphoglycolate phosphatase-like HAD superfamily hydrolase